MSGKGDNAPKIMVLEDKLSLVPLHVFNVSYDALMLLLCSGGRRMTAVGEFYCQDTYTVGNGAIVSLVVLLMGEANTSMVGLHAVAWYHMVNLFLHFRRALLVDQGKGDWTVIVTVSNIVLFVAAVVMLISEKQLAVDTLSGVLASCYFMSSYQTSIYVQVVNSLMKAVPVLLMARRVYAIKDRDEFATKTALGLLLCSLADFAIEYYFIAGLAIFLVAHVFFLVAFANECKDIGLVRGFPIIAYGAVVYSILFPKLGDMRLPVGLYVITIMTMLWRALMLSPGNDWGVQIALGALLFSLSDTLIALNRFFSPIENSRFSILGLYWLGQLLITQGTISRSIWKKTRSENSSDAEPHNSSEKKMQ